MLQLIKLEIKKYKLKRYIKGVIIAIICIMAFLTMSFIDNKIHSPKNLDTYQSVIWMINVLSIDVFLIFSSALMAKIVIGEYRDKTILVMFSYPINRKKLILAKLIIVVVFAMVCIMMSNILCMLYAVTLDSIVDVIAGSFKFYYISDSLWTFLGFTVMGGVLALMPFTVSMRKKSVPSAVVTAVIIAGLMQPVIGRDAEFTETFIKLAIVTLLVLVFTVYTMIKKINNIDYADVA